jgi:hypothetical protein
MPTTLDTRLDTHVSDLLGLELHLGRVVRGQIAELACGDNPLLDDLAALRDFAANHASMLTALRAARGCPEGEGGSGAIGQAAAALARLGIRDRHPAMSEPSRDTLRDDLGACGMAESGYAVLYITAVRLRDREVACIAWRHLTDYRDVLARCYRMLPAVVSRRREEEGNTRQARTMRSLRRTLATAWQAGDDEGATSRDG